MRGITLGSDLRDSSPGPLLPQDVDVRGSEVGPDFYRYDIGKVDRGQTPSFDSKYNAPYLQTRDGGSAQWT